MIAIRKKKIRLGMIRCDGHAYTFGPLLDKCDPLVFREYFHSEYFWMIDSCHPWDLRTPIVPGFELAKVYDTDPREDTHHAFAGRTDNAENLARTFFGKPEVCRSLEEMTEGIDAAFINNCNGNGDDHLDLAAPFLKKGIPTYVDKPFASTLADARKMVRLAVKYDAPLLSASILSFVGEVKLLRRRFCELEGRVSFGVVKGVGSRATECLGAVIHGISLALAMFGPGVESVECMGSAPLEHVLLHYGDDVDVVVMNTPHGFEGFRCDVYSDQGHNPPCQGLLRSRRIYDHEFVGGALNIVRLFKKMLRTGAPPVPYEALLEPIAIIEAARRAQRERTRVHLNEVWERGTRM